MPFRNTEGQSVDPVPFLIISILGATVNFTFGPPYLMTIGISFQTSLGICLLLTGLVVMGAYYRYVYTATPQQSQPGLADTRIERLYYAILIGLLVIVLLALPLLIGVR